MKMLARDGLRDERAEEGRALPRRPARPAARHKEIGDVDGLGLALRAEICDRRRLHAEQGAARPHGRRSAWQGDLEHDGQKIGLVLDVGGYYKNVITFAPSLHITHEEIDLGDRAARPVADEGQEGADADCRWATYDRNPVDRHRVLPFRAN